ncbi:hypothetical protein DVDV_2436 [Desulfovibrio sp. DV]|uniref:hypothetical protein n=1 Tax=Desulfovibrio sp. DV TaxID=1844708 RepID=UPI00094BC03E|nr:hypothetical protein [Desulfovibrio sp. DV]OLN26820.1 hypothetical protein DVDV_2436 [Desulfovibrio sp. DV]
MILFRGNCQMQFTAEAAAAAGLDVSFASLASPLTLTASPGVIPPLVSALIDGAKVGEYLHTRELIDQFLPPSVTSGTKALVVNLFHENRPLFLHKTERYAFYLDPAAFARKPALGRAVEAKFQTIVPNPASYLDRYAAMLHLFRERLPGLPILVVGRLGHYPGLGPAPHSYLQGWGEVCFTAAREFAAWVGTLPDTCYLDADRIMAGAFRRAGAPVEAHFPFLRLTRSPDGGRVAVSRDLEHAGSLWPALVAKIAATLETGRVDYAPEETVPESWQQPFVAEELNPQALLEHLVSGSNYRAARAVGYLLFHPETDGTALLNQAAPYMPVCHNLLHMVRAYGQGRPDPALAEWCDNHAALAAAFTANGEAYRREYLEKIEALRQLVLASTTV